MQLLLQEGHANVNVANAYGNTALHEAARNGYTDLMHVLIEAKANVNARNHHNNTPLHFYCYGSPEHHPVAGVKMLLKAGAEFDGRDDQGMTPLLVCCTSGRSDIITLLMDVGANCHVKDALGRDAHDIGEFHKHSVITQRFGHDSPMKRFAH